MKDEDKIDPRIAYELFQTLGMSPQDKGSYFIVVCPECGKKECFNYKGSPFLKCNRRNKCGYNANVHEIFRQELNNILKEDRLFFDKPAEVPEKKEAKLELPSGMVLFKDLTSLSLMSRQAIEYLKNRNISNNRIKSLGYVYEPNSRFNRTIFIPFYENGEIVYFTCRDWTGKRFTRDSTGELKSLRYINPEGISSHDFVFNIDEINNKEPLFIFEGVFDALSLDEQVATCSMTTNIGIKQIVKIWEKQPKYIVLVTDNDTGGETTLLRNYKIIMRYKPPSSRTEILRYRIPKEFKDFNEFKSKEKVSQIDINKCDRFSMHEIMESEIKRAHFSMSP